MGVKQRIKEIIYRLRGDHTTEFLIKRGMVVGENFKRLNGVILDPAHCWLIKIGDNVTMAPRVHILCHDASTKQFLGYTKIGKVTIGNNVFIGAGTIVLPNITIDNNVIIGANCTVTKNLNSGVYIGNPVKRICSIQEYLDKESYEMTRNPVYDEDYTLRGNLTKERKEQMIKELEGKKGFII